MRFGQDSADTRIMSKEFKTIKVQILLLNSRGIKTNQETEARLMRESYYAIVNGYKTPFLDKQAMKAHSNDRFLAGTEFEWIFALYSFDRDLRSLVFQFLDKTEATMQNAVTYAFCKKRALADCQGVTKAQGLNRDWGATSTSLRPMINYAISNASPTDWIILLLPQE